MDVLMNKREWLRSQGFEVGDRGRFSLEMQEALEEFEKPAVEEEAYVPPPRKPKRTDGVRYYVAKLKGGQVLRFDMCPSCQENIAYCSCRTVGPPKWLAEEVVSWIKEV
jgi:hypothetical protein